MPCLALAGVGSSIKQSRSLRAKVLIRASLSRARLCTLSNLPDKTLFLDSQLGQRPRDQRLRCDRLHRRDRSNAQSVRFSLSHHLLLFPSSVSDNSSCSYSYDVPPGSTYPNSSTTVTLSPSLALSPSATHPQQQHLKPSDLITHILYLTNGRVPIDVQAIEVRFYPAFVPMILCSLLTFATQALGIRTIAVESSPSASPNAGGGGESPMFGTTAVRKGLERVLAGVR